MNKVILMGRLTRDPQVRYTQGQDPMAIARFTLAVDRRGRKQEGQQDADFPSCVAFGKSAEFVEKYVHQGTKIVLTGRIQTGSYTNMQVEPEEVEKVIRKTEAEWNLSPDKAAETLKMISDAAVKLNMVFTEMMENIRQVADKISEIFRRIHENNTMTETQIRKRELWRRYYEEKSRMSNNERRRRGIPMVKRPKRQQYRPPKKKTTKGK